MLTFLRTLVLTAVAVGAIACVPHNRGFNGNSDFGYGGGFRDRGDNSCRYGNDCRYGRGQDWRSSNSSPFGNLFD